MNRRDVLRAGALGGAALGGMALAAGGAPVSDASAQSTASTPGGAAAPSPARDGRGDRYAGDRRAGRSAVLAQRGMVCTAHPLATQIGLDILKGGGSAVDAAIAANAALGLMEPVGCGIGGDLFALVWDPKTRTLQGLNASGRSPRGQTLKQLEQRLRTAKLAPTDQGIPDWGGLSVTVPGCVDGWFELAARFGRLDMAQLLRPTIDYAREGFPVTPVIAPAWARNMTRFEQLATGGSLEEVLNARRTFTPGGRAPQEGELFRNPDLASTLEILGRDGRDAFYRGALARRMDGYFKRIGAPLRLADFAAHKSDWVTPISARYRGVDVFQIPPPGQGMAGLQMLQLLEGYDLRRMGFGSADYVHLLVEAKKLAFEDRARFYADPAFYKADVAPRLLSADYVASRRALIDPARAATSVDHGDPKLIAGDTTYLCTADQDGMMVSLIQSNYRGMGSGLVPDGLGFMLQDRGAQFALDPKHPNVYAPAKRPFHTIIPGFAMRNGEPWLAFGVMGGAMQPQGHAQVLINMIDFDMDVQLAGDVARVHHTGSTEPTLEAGRMTDGGIVELEEGFPDALVSGLQARGHTVQRATGPHGGYQAIQVDARTRVYRGASEFRKDGAAAGY
jgi:gamma-glutamyltranspeptidase/glutathione hydrolase